MLFVVIANLGVFVLLGRLDGFLHIELYSYGLIFNSDWANEYWRLNGMLWTFLAGATVFTAVSMVLHYFHSKNPSRLSKWAGFFVPIIAIIYQAISIMYLNQINDVVWNKLYDYGVRYDIDWSATYNPISMPALTLMVVALLALIIPAIRTLDIIQIEIVQEDEFEDVTAEDSEEEVEPQEIVQPLGRTSSASTALERKEPKLRIFAESTALEREEIESKSLTVLKSTEQAVLLSAALENSSVKSAPGRTDETKPSLAVLQSREPADGSEKPAVEEEKLERVEKGALVAIVKKTAKKQRKRSRRKRRRSRAKAQVSSGKATAKKKKTATAEAKTLGEVKTAPKAMQLSPIKPTMESPVRRKKTLEIVGAQKLAGQNRKKPKKRSRRKRRKTRTKAPSPQA